MTNTADHEGRIGVPAQPQLYKSGDWMKMFRRVRFDKARDGVRGATIKAVGTMLATYADYDNGTDIHPGTARIAIDCEVDYRTAKRCIAILRDLGLIVLTKKADRRGYSDVYRLGWPQDLVGRVDIEEWDPDRYQLEIARVREKHRGTYKPAAKAGDLRGTEGTAEVPSFEPPPESSAGHAGHRRTESAGHAGTNLRGTPCPPTYQGTYQGFVPSAEEDLSAEVAVSRAKSREDPISPPLDLAPSQPDPCVDNHDSVGDVKLHATQPRGSAEVIPITRAARDACTHGNSSRRNKKSGLLRCEVCRAEEAKAVEVDRIEHAAATVQVGQSRCAEHKLPAHLCTFCRRGIRGG